jgi:diacylglycerol kinase family enzyme
MGALARLRTATWFASERSSNVPPEEGSRVPADSITIEAPPRADSSANGQGSAERARKKRMLIVVNPYATTVSDRLKNLVVYALQGRYDVEAVSTEAQHHAIEIGREAREGGYDVVVAFGGDGTLNEVANGLAGTDVPVSVLPGGSTNVVCRTLGIPNDVVDATEHLLGLADDFRPRKIDLGLASGRHFVFACGAGLDATAAKRVDSSPRLKARGGRWFYTWAAVSGFYRHYLRDPIRMRLEVDGHSAEGVTAIVQNSDPFTYFGTQPLRVCEGAALDNGTLSVAMLGRAAQRDMPTIAARVLLDGLRASRHRQVAHFEELVDGRIESMSHDARGAIRPFPVQVDGDYIGDLGELEIGIEPGALTVVA